MTAGPKDQVVGVSPARVGKGRPVYVVTEREGRSFWTVIGSAHDNADGSTTIRLDKLPLVGTLQVRQSAPPEHTADCRRWWGHPLGGNWAIHDSQAAQDACPACKAGIPRGAQP